MLDSTMQKSAGYAFVEFKKHEEAKKFLDSLVENPQQIMNRLYVAEFAIQDSRKMLKLQKSKKIQKEAAKGNDVGHKEVQK